MILKNPIVDIADENGIFEEQLVLKGLIINEYPTKDGNLRELLDIVQGIFIDRAINDKNIEEFNIEITDIGDLDKIIGYITSEIKLKDSKEYEVYTNIIYYSDCNKED